MAGPPETNGGNQECSACGPGPGNQWLGSMKSMAGPQEINGCAPGNQWLGPMTSMAGLGLGNSMSGPQPATGTQEIPGLMARP